MKAKDRAKLKTEAEAKSKAKSKEPWNAGSMKGELRG
jgi:hypothetical protein